MSGPELITLGCRLNIAESEAIRALASGEDELVVVNSCAVTAEAVRRSAQAIRSARRRRPEARILVTGCAAEIEPDRFAAMPEVSAVVPNARKGDPAAFRSRPVAPDASPPPRPFAGHARGFVAVQTGCDHRCTFCIIPFGRGPSRSMPAGEVIRRVRALVEHGFAEIVLTGVDLTSYGADLPGAPSLGLLVERILRHVPALGRLRLSSLDAVEIDARLFDLIASEPRVMPHLHLSLQSGDDLILKRMKRRHARAQAIDLIGRLKALRPEIAIGADLIAGFPTETDAMAANSLRLIDECDIVFGHIFPYSPRPGTPAARMPQVAAGRIAERAAALREAAARRHRDWLDTMTGSVHKILIERDGITGHAENFAKVRHVGEAAQRPSESSAGDRGPGRDGSLRGTIVPLRIVGRDGDILLGMPA